MSGYNVKSEDDLFRVVDKLRKIKNDIKSLTRKEALFVKVKNYNCKILGRVRSISHYYRYNRKEF